ncbi:MAG: hypothetical protein JWQ42_2559 [Edaphobacter sp.]|nr:hypothetical protein [Edaphobacter sp.]
MAGADAAQDSGEIVAGEEKDIGGQVKCRVEEGVETYEAAETDEPGNLRRETAEGGDGKGGEEEIDRPVAGEVGDVVDGVGVESEGAGGVEVQEPGEGNKAKDVEQGFDGDDGSSGHGLAWVFGSRFSIFRSLLEASVLEGEGLKRTKLGRGNDK